MIDYRKEIEALAEEMDVDILDFDCRESVNDKVMTRHFRSGAIRYLRKFRDRLRSILAKEEGK